MERQQRDQVQQFVQGSTACKDAKKAYAKKEAHQMAKDVAGFLCRRQSGLERLPIPKGNTIVRVDTTCSECDDRSGEAFIVDGRKLCRICKLKMEHGDEKKKSYTFPYFKRLFLEFFRNRKRSYAIRA